MRSMLFAILFVLPLGLSAPARAADGLTAVKSAPSRRRVVEARMKTREEVST